MSDFLFWAGLIVVWHMCAWFFRIGILMLLAKGAGKAVEGVKGRRKKKGDEKAVGEVS